MEKEVLERIVNKYSKTKLHNWAKLKYVDSEVCLQNMIMKKYEKILNLKDNGGVEFDKLQAEYNFEPKYYIIMQMLSQFSLNNPNYKMINDNIKLFNNTSVKIDYDNTVFLFNSDELNFSAMKMANVIPEVKQVIPDIESASRVGKCHPYSVLLAMFLDNFNLTSGADIYLATDNIYQLSQTAKYMHSWVEICLFGKEYVFDATKNLIIDKNAYYEINHISNPEKVNSKQLLLDFPKIKKLTEYDSCLANVYYENAQNGRMVYDTLVKRGEIIEKQPY